MPQFSSEHPNSVIERRVALTEALNESLERFCLIKEETFDEVVELAMSRMAEAIGVGQITVYRFLKMGERYRIKPLYRWDAAAGELFIGKDLLPEDSTFQGWLSALLDHQVINTRYSDSSEDEREFMDSVGVKAFLSVPVFSRGDYWGCVSFQDMDNDRLFYEDCLDLMKSLARLCARAIINDETWHHLVEAEERTRAMLDAAPLYTNLWTRDFQIIDCNEPTVVLFGFKSKQECLRRFAELSPKYQPDGQLSKHKLRMNLVKAFEVGRSFFDWTHRLPDGTLLPVEMTMVRVRYKGEFVVAGFARDLLQIKTMESNIIRLETESEKIYYDSLTGILNRRFFDENLSRVIKTLSRSGGSLSLLMIDIDFFKNYNDIYGHSAGDDCLKTIAETLASSVTRADDFVVRYGGEEFAVVLPNTDEEGARKLADKMLESVLDCRIPHSGSSVSKFVTASFGVTTGKVRNRSRADDFIIRADELLYMSKQNGRNRSTYGKM